MINLPLGRLNSKVYNLYQSLGGYPHAEGAVSRTPDSAFDYMRGNTLLNAWYGQRPIHCEMVEQEAYRSGLAQLQEDGFSHIVFHHHDIIRDWEEIGESFHDIEPAFHNGFTSIYRLRDLGESCPDDLSTRHRFTRVYADALQASSLLAKRHGLVLVFPPNARVNDHFLRYLRHFAEIDRTIATLSMDAQAKINIPKFRRAGRANPLLISSNSARSGCLMIRWNSTPSRPKLIKNGSASDSDSARDTLKMNEPPSISI